MLGLLLHVFISPLASPRRAHALIPRIVFRRQKPALGIYHGTKIVIHKAREFLACGPQCALGLCSRFRGRARIAVGSGNFGLGDGLKGPFVGSLWWAICTCVDDVDIGGVDEAGGGFWEGGFGAGGAGVGFLLGAEVFGADAGFFLVS